MIENHVRSSGEIRDRPKGRTCGLISTYIHGCRCQECRETMRMWMADYRRRKRLLTH